MHRTLKSIISSSLFLSLSLLPTLATADQGTNTQFTGQHQEYTSGTDNTRPQSTWNTNQGTAGQQNWSNTPQTTYTNTPPQGWSNEVHYSYAPPVEHPVDDNIARAMGMGQHSTTGEYYTHPSYGYQSNIDYNRNGVIEPWEQQQRSNYTYVPGFHRVRGKYYNTTDNAGAQYYYGNPNSYGYPTYDNYYYDNQQPYQDDSGVGAGVYFNVR